jgi:hypothetical protein
MDNFDTDKLLRYISTIYNTPEKIFRSEDDVVSMRQQRAQAQQQQVQNENAVSQSTALKNTAQAIQ